ncbi:hypothetical protein HMPREF1983_01470, partial [Gemella bergeri ATCC 700627]
LIIAYILSLYVVSDFLKMYISRSLGIEGSISWFSGVAFSNIQMFISFIYIGIIYLLFKLTHKKEF